MKKTNANLGFKVKLINLVYISVQYISNKAN